MTTTQMTTQRSRTKRRRTICWGNAVGRLLLDKEDGTDASLPRGVALERVTPRWAAGTHTARAPEDDAVSHGRAAKGKVKSLASGQKGNLSFGLQKVSW